jgi:primosomal protein N'
MHNKATNPRTATIFTDTSITLDSLHNVNNHACIVEEIKKRVAILESSKWQITVSWVKTHVGVYDNELADRRAKEAALSNNTSIAFNKIPKSTLYHEVAEAKQQWQIEWRKCAKAAITKNYFPTVQDMMKKRINPTPKLTAMVTGNGKTRKYLHLFKLMGDVTCVCRQEDEVLNH